MLDFNHRPKFHEQVIALVDHALQQQRARQPARAYLGGSRLGIECARALQFEITHTPPDPGRETPGRILRIFQIGHVLEDLVVDWLRLAGFTLHTRNAQGEQFGFSVVSGRIQGHIDGVFSDGPTELALAYPMLFECKSMNNAAWKDTVKHGVAVSKPVYAAQMSVYQAYLADRIPGIADHPALLAAINKDTAELHVELVPFDAALAQRMSDRGVQVLTATDAHELLPRISTTPTHLTCKSCDWQDRCWRLPA